MGIYINQILFGYYPYIVFAVMIIGSIARYKYSEYHWSASSSQLLRARGMKLGSNLFHIGIVAILLGHLIGLLTPHQFYTHFISISTKQILAIAIGGFFGIICFIGLTILVYRRLFDPRIRFNSCLGDTLILLFLYAQLILGLATIPFSLQHLDGHNMVILATWAQDIVTVNKGAAQLMLNQSLIFKVHIFLGLTIFLILPFTRLIHIWSIPFQYFFRRGLLIERRGRRNLTCDRF